ncbi:MAG: hypothetical protein ACYDAK_12850 [Candidatus Limnocylindrales bacterium]
MGALSQGINPLINAWTKVGAGITWVPFSTTAAMTLSINLFQLVAAGVLTRIKLKHSTSFQGGLISAMTASVGIAGDLARYSSAFDVFQAPGNTILELSSGAWCENQGAPTQVLLTLTATGANLNALTQGQLDVWALVSTAN